jgi:hypothetical protein
LANHLSKLDFDFFQQTLSASFNMFRLLSLGLLLFSAVSHAQQGFEPLDPYCFQASRLLLCSEYQSSLFESCIKHSQPEMFFYHRPTKSVCAGMTLALCTSGDFCEQSRHEDVKNNPEDSTQMNPAQATPPVPNLLDPVTPVSGSSDFVAGDRSQRNFLSGTRFPGPSTPMPDTIHSEEEEVGIQLRALHDDKLPTLVSWQTYFCMPQRKWSTLKFFTGLSKANFNQWSP